MAETTVIDSTPTPVTDTILEQEAKPAETPPAETKKVEPKGESMLANFKVVTPHSALVPEPPKEEPKKEEAKPEEKPVDKAAKPDAKPEDNTLRREQFKRLEEAKRLAEELAEKRKAELETARKEIEEAKKRALEETEAIRAENQRMHGELRTAAIERDPEFQEKYVKAEARRTAELKELAAAAGYTDKQFDAAFARGDEETLAEIEAALDPAQKRKWNNHLLKIEEIRDEKKQAIAESEKTWQELQNKHKQAYTDQAKEAVAKNTEAADAAIEEIKAMAPGIENDTDLLDNVRDMLLDVAGATENSAKWTTKEILKNVAYAQIQAKVVVNLGKELETSKARIAELEEKLSEADKFVAERTASSPRGNGVSGKVVTEEGSMLSRLNVRIPGR